MYGHQKLSGHKKLSGHQMIIFPSKVIWPKKLSVHKKLSSQEKLFSHTKLFCHLKVLQPHKSYSTKQNYSAIKSYPAIQSYLPIYLPISYPSSFFLVGGERDFCRFTSIDCHFFLLLLKLLIIWICMRHWFAFVYFSVFDEPDFFVVCIRVFFRI